MKVFLAVQREPIAALFRHGGGADGVAAGIGFGDGKAKSRLAAASLGQIAGLLLFRAIFGDKSETHRGADHEVEQRDAVVRQSFKEQVHLDHALSRAAILLRHHGADEAVFRDLTVQRLREDVLLGAIHPVFAIEFLRDHIAVFENLPLLVRQIKVHRGTLRYGSSVQLRPILPANECRSRHPPRSGGLILLAIFRQKPLGFQSNNRQKSNKC